MNKLIPLIGLFLLASFALADTQLDQAEIARRSEQVMPFNLSATQHQFNKTACGGIQTVLVRDINNTKQVLLIQQHLAHMAANFKQGDFSMPISIHGSEMPGIKVLQAAKPGMLQIEYQSQKQGARIVFCSQQHELVHAIHRWFDAQLHDHGADAVLIDNQ